MVTEPLTSRPPPLTVAAPFGAFAVEVLSLTSLSVTVGVTLPSLMSSTAASAPASPFGVVTTAVLCAIRVSLIDAGPSISNAVGPLGPVSALERTFTVRLLRSILVSAIVRSTKPQEQNATSAPNGSPAGFETVMLLALMLEWLIATVEPSERKSPPPSEFARSLLPS
jgi:hypothetical protein